jgi:DNA-binding HxlR family transcriptional regulator
MYRKPVDPSDGRAWAPTEDLGGIPNRALRIRFVTNYLWDKTGDAGAMQSMTDGGRAELGRSSKAVVAPGTEAEVERAFQDFREASVRLAERIQDLRGPEPDPVAAARQDLHLVRAIFGKWSTDVLLALHAVPSAGFEELRRGLTGISPRVLSLKLKELEESGMVHREIIDARPPRVRYALTDRGWTVGWLAQPVLLYLRLTDTPNGHPRKSSDGAPRDDPEG